MNFKDLEIFFNMIYFYNEQDIVINTNSTPTITWSNSTTYPTHDTYLVGGDITLGNNSNNNGR